ncbi:hypothetical protein AGRA3207_003044 [Actinomadura graeca]|uniref:Uncharacterized protein n=1 Tax=Actinomadura graeca TaxID=2750812 RepID=A0ABX8QTY2_9ACTN|nr:hypothetical protein [Actinomadura graeca]QXJ22098.1 hypothetical protein AGRA3207_003044 [Actinomadura graeca]
MVRQWTRAGLAIVLAGCALLPASSAVPRIPPAVDAETTRQLTAAASTLLERRSQALVQQRHHDRRPPAEVLGVRISPRVAHVQERAVRELETRNRAPVEGGPAYTGARTRLEAGKATRAGDRITLEAVEHTEVRYDTGKLTQSVRRRFEFRTRGEQITLIGERVLDPSARPVNDPDLPSR